MNEVSIKKLLVLLLLFTLSACGNIKTNNNLPTKNQPDYFARNIECQQFLENIKREWIDKMGRDEVSVFYSPQKNTCLFKTSSYVEYSDGRGGEFWEELFDLFTGEQIFSCKTGIEPPMGGCVEFDKKIKKYSERIES